MLEISLDELAWLATDGLMGFLASIAILAWWRWR
jgi:hypothetical protein